MSKVIGIDLGTTNSCVAVIDNGEPVVIPNSEGSRTTASVVGFTQGGERRVGQIAKRQAVTNPECTVYSVKRLMGRKFDSEEAKRHAAHVPYQVVAGDNADAAVLVHGKQHSPPEVSAMILRAMREVAEDYLGHGVSEAVITVPAYFDDAQRQATKAAGRIAGLKVKRIINEPTAASLAYGLEHKGAQRIVVYDLGGGTFDVSVLEISAGVFNVRSTCGDTLLGGEDFDQRVIEYLAQGFEKDTGISLLSDRIALQRLKEQAERARHELSSSLETEINLPFIAADRSGPKHLVRTLKRAELELMVDDLVERTLKPCQQALDDGCLSKDEIDAIILVGGMTRMPLVQRRVQDFFGRTPSKDVSPDEVVAVGAALQGAALGGQMDEVLLLDVTPLSIGVETGGGVFHKLIPRNTTVPTRKGEIFTTSLDNQAFVPVHVLQGERNMAADNTTLAKFELAPIPPAPRGVPQIQVSFDVDANGIVHVSAKDLGTGREQSIRVTSASGLSEAKIQRLIDEAESYRQSDAKRRELAELRNSAEALLYSSENAVRECGDLVPADVIQAAQADIEMLREHLDANADAIAIREGLQQLEISAYAIADAMYGADSEEEAATTE
ncbi:MAG: molecular chaperone DnaK [Proteobacteria bacterium]|nr:molecular chaperone DnaK [Pseudomonadota bacterium]